MATYAIGDVQGCYATLQRLVARIKLRSTDRLWFVGDLVNRGPASLEVLRFVRGMGDRAVAVLGNHDLHLLGLAEGVADTRPRDTLDIVLSAPDRRDLIDWLRHRPLIHVEGGHVLVHAGIPPQWTIADAVKNAAEVEAQLQGPHLRDALVAIEQKGPSRWDDSLNARQRLQFTVAALTRLRTCKADGHMSLGFKGAPSDAPPGCQPWFQVETRRSKSAVVIFGHWAALGHNVGRYHVCLDTGCVWGHHLTAMRLEDGTIFQEPAVEVRGS
jgi:bis(5'-nucleosyl)-tetraphosphatase (symmetrical)